MVLSEPLTSERIGLSFRFDRGALEHRILPVGTDQRSIALPNVSAARISKSKRFRLVLHPAGTEPLFYEFDLTRSAAAIAAVPCKR